MAKKVLNNTHRDILNNLARKLVQETADRAEADTAYEAAATMVRKLVDEKYPPAEMAILKKYDAGREDSCIFVSAGYGGMERFSFRDGDERVPYIPHRYCNSRTPHLMNDDQVKILDAHKAAHSKFTNETEQRYHDYKTLIANSRTFEELVEIWPAADQLRERICGTSRAVSVMSEDVLARIRADAANKVAEEA